MTNAEFNKMIAGVESGDVKSVADARVQIRRVADEGHAKALLFMLYGMRALMNHPLQAATVVNNAIAVRSN